MEGHKGIEVSGPRSSSRVRAVGVGVLILTVFGWAALPVSLAAWGRKAKNPARNAMTVGCAEASCCTSRCYLDENGVHHCVPNEGESCECGLSSRPKASEFAFSHDLQVPPKSAESFSCDPPLTEFLGQTKPSETWEDSAVPTPPPR
jgi:hypothetical protein